jgi:hypothetical protein
MQQPHREPRLEIGDVTRHRGLGHSRVSDAPTKLPASTMAMKALILESVLESVHCFEFQDN